MAYSNRELLARLVKCEAGGEGENGMRAVATVVMNRVHAVNGEYQRVNQGNLRRVIFQPGQFDCTFETIRGMPNTQNIYNANPEDIHFEIADWAIEGNIFGAVWGCLWYLNPYASCMGAFPRNGSGRFHTRINNHCFYLPTDLYADT
jgi:N-acetylmuramoyl-L-alanine amidase